MKSNKRFLALMLLAVALIIAFASCGKDDESSSSKPPVSQPGSSSTAEGTVQDITPKFTQLVEEKVAQNSDTVGWLQVPYTTISDVVVQNKDDNEFYRRRNFEKAGEFNGVYYADFRNDFGDGSREALPINTTIYGHALTDDPESPNYDVKFAPLHEFRNVNIANENPYLFFSTGKEDYVYEVISVFVANADNADNPYNQGDAEKGTFHEIVRKEVLPRSLYDYGIDISDDDKFLTLSTCIYVLEDGTQTNYPNTYYRYGIMARLVGPDEPLVESLDLKVNPDRIIDKDEAMASAK